MIEEKTAEPMVNNAGDHTDTAIKRWVDGIFLAARHMGIAISPQQIRNASAWSTQSDLEQAVIDIAHSAGLVGQFVTLSGDDLSPAMLPALVQVEDKYIGLVCSNDHGKLRLLMSVKDRPIERIISAEHLQKISKDRVLLLHVRETIRDTRLDQYLRERPKSWLTGVFSSNWRVICELGLGSLFGNLLAIGTALFAMQVWDRVVPARSTNTLWVLASGVALALLLEFLIRTARVAIADHFGKQADLRLSAMFFSRVMDIRNDARPRSPGTLISQLRDLEQLRELLTSSTLGLLIDLPFVLTFLFIIWFIGGYLALVPLIAVPLLIVPGLLAQIPLARLSNEGLTESALRNAILMESIYRIEDIKILQAEPRFRSLWNNANTVSADINLKQRRVGALLVNFSQMVQQMAYVGVIIVGVYGILNDTLSFGAVLACSILTSRTIAPLGQISAVLGRVQNARVGKKALDTLLSLPVDHDPGEDAYHKPALVGSYRFENVVYLYGPEEKPALIIPNLKIEPGERIAILGRVGAGKSTFLRLAGGLATPSQGRILFNNTTMGLIDVADVRRDIGLLLQESNLFYGSVRENLLIANPLASDEQVLEAMHLSCADQLLLNQPHGLDLKLREGGQGLSGGQKQALILARAFLRSPNIMLLDEPTASLDEMTEQTIISRLKNWLNNRTLIVATHRYPILSLVDRIIVINGGRIVRDGPRDEILRNLSRAEANAADPQKPYIRTVE